MTRTPKPDASEWVDTLLDDVGKLPPADPRGDLMARVLADAHAMMPPPGGAQKPRDPGWRQVVRLLGGWTSVGGLVAATAFGFAVGLGGLDSVGVDLDAVWLLDGAVYVEDAEMGLGAFGWDIEETGA
ncbi:MAG: hypothetical protein AAFY39_18045 [Pseudomonadota bacterium]